MRQAELSFLCAYSEAKEQVSSRGNGLVGFLL
jgi:hypothetical protein